MLVQVNNITKTYGNKENAFRALKGVSFAIERGESVAIVGKSGSGKSTLMHLLATLDTPTTGSILFNYQNLARFGAKELEKIRNQEFGFVFQQFFLNARESVLENVTLPLKIKGVPKKEREQAGLSALREVDLEEKAYARANDLSGGQKQRVCIARALVATPGIIFADEPTGNLDSETGDKIIDLLFDLHARGITLIIVTHDEELAARCERILVMKDGLLEGITEGRRSERAEVFQEKLEVFQSESVGVEIELARGWHTIVTLGKRAIFSDGREKWSVQSAHAPGATASLLKQYLESRTNIRDMYPTVFAGTDAFGFRMDDLHGYAFVLGDRYYYIIGPGEVPPFIRFRTI